MSNNNGAAIPSIMTSSTTRRNFCRAAIGLPLLGLAGCSRQESSSGTSTPPQPAPAGEWAPLIADLQKRLPALLAEAKTVPAVSMALVADAKLLWRGAFGVKDVGSKTPIDHDTVFEAGSVSKTVFAYVVMKLCEKKVLELDTPLTKYTTERFLTGDPRLDRITPRHILSHTGGFQNWRTPKDPLTIQFTPGERWSYSGEGYSYLQSVVTHLIGHVNAQECDTFENKLKVCASDIDEVMKAALLRPFGMMSSGYLQADNMARPHNDKGAMDAKRKSTAIGAARYGAAGGLNTTPTDYTKFLIEILDPKPADAARLSSESLKEMVRPHVKVTDTLSWALGWAIEHKPDGSSLISHTGDNPGFKTLTAASLTKKSGYVIMTNGDRGFDEFIAKIAMSEPMQRFLPVALG
jgi:CubicO group peptidase (beta-lactamase class C family)